MKYIVLDVETNDLFDYTKPADAPGQPRLCDIAMHFLDDDMQVERTVNHLIKPEGWVIDPTGEANRVNGITMEMLEAEGVPVRDVVREYGAGIDERRIVVAFSAPFDIKMMRAELRRSNYPDRYMQTRYICLMQGSRKIVNAKTDAGKNKVPSLDQACIHFGFEPEPKPHRAIQGADRALWILRALRDLGAVPAYKDPYEKK